MRIDHIAIWCEDLEKMKDFYITYFNGRANEKYVNPRTSFSSYFISYDDGCRLELMQRPDVKDPHQNNGDFQALGFIHMAVSVGGVEQVDALTARLKKDGYAVIGEPRWTGDGCYESVVLDPENNRVEITS